MSNKVGSVEGIRGVACFMVVLSHLSLTFFPFLHGFIGKAGDSHSIQGLIHNSPFGFLYSGTAAVYIFFVLSGYILSYVALKNSHQKILSMSLKRYPRLMIPAVVSCVFAYLLLTFMQTDKSMLAPWINKYGNFDYSLTGAVYSGTLESFVRGRSLYNPILWTMQIELMGSFLVFGLCYLVPYKKPLIFTISFIMILLVATGVQLISANLGLGLISFIIGHLFYLYGRHVSSSLSLLLLIIGLYLAGTHNDSLSYVPITSIIGSKSYAFGNFFSGIMIVYAILFSDSLNALFSKKLFIFMGKVSFSVYLIHVPIISTVGVFTFNVLHQSFNYDTSAILSSLLVILSTYILAIYYYKFVDHRGMVLSDKFSRKILGWINYKHQKNRVQPR